MNINEFTADALRIKKGQLLICFSTIRKKSLKVIHVKDKNVILATLFTIKQISTY